jgi:hypothetical protein
MAETAVDASKASGEPSHPPHKDKFWALALGSVGVVFGDIGTSPLYAMREALAHSKGGGGGEMAVLGVISLITWALILVVTLKYVLFLMRADNKGEGGTLALMALAQRVSPGGRSAVIFVLGMAGAALFYGDGILTPAVSVLSAVEGIGKAPGVGPGFASLSCSRAALPAWRATSDRSRPCGSSSLPALEFTTSLTMSRSCGRFHPPTAYCSSWIMASLVSSSWAACSWR